jgi:hypothetical protein
MARKHGKTKNRNDAGRFVGIPVHILESQEYAALQSNTVKLLLDLLCQYNGYNNGDLCATWSLLSKRGWKSRDTRDRALKQLLASSFIVKTRQGEKGHTSGHRKPTLYAVTWLGIDECKGKLDIRPNPAPLNTWKNNCSTRFPCHTDTHAVLKA